jgi:hypothetical protein
MILKGAVAPYIKPSDVTYAYNLIDPSLIATGQDKIAWLNQFVAWYGDTPIDRIRLWAETNGHTDTRTTVAAAKKATAVVKAAVASAKASTAPSKAEAAADLDETAPPPQMTSPTPFMRYGFIGLAAVALIGAGAAYTIGKRRK